MRIRFSRVSISLVASVLVGASLFAVMLSASCGGCPAGQTMCGSACRELISDPANCGSCGKACAAGQLCAGGQCVLSCQQGFTVCSGSCRDTQSDVKHCGACDMACASGQVCGAGKCTLSCPAGLTSCAGSCRDLMTDNANCGACMTACAAGQACTAGKCAVTCQMGLTNCNGTCANLQSDNANCGMCGKACAGGEACAAGKCGVTCPTGFTNCSGVCANLQIDIANCGACGKACRSGEACTSGNCVLSCQTGLTNCSGSCINTQSDNANCGACGMACPSGKVCSGGQCAATCGAPLTACGGVCVDPRFDPDHCNGCAMPCPAPPNAARVCVMGACGMGPCAAGYYNCDGASNNGCEINGNNDNKNCGGCGKVCPNVANGTPGCVAGTCGIGNCNTNFQDCDQSAGNGCEINLSTDNNNCGLCGKVCAGGTICTAGSCVMVTWQGAGATWVAGGKSYGRYTWAQAGTTNNGRANAEAYCTGKGGTLARPNSQSEWDALHANLASDGSGWWMDGHNNFTCGTATVGNPKPYQYGFMYTPAGQASLYTGCNCTMNEMGLVAYRYAGGTVFDGCQNQGGTQNGWLGVMDEQLTYSHNGIQGFICSR